MWDDSLAARRGENQRAGFEIEEVGPLLPGQRRKVLVLGVMATPRTNNAVLPAVYASVVLTGIPAIAGALAHPMRYKRADGTRGAPVPVADAGARVGYADVARVAFLRKIITRAIERGERLRILRGEHVTRKGDRVITFPDKGKVQRWHDLDTLVQAIIDGVA